MTDLWKKLLALRAEWQSLQPRWRRIVAGETAAIVVLLMLLAAGA